MPGTNHVRDAIILQGQALLFNLSLSAFSLDITYFLQVIDKNPNRKAGEFEDLSKVEKFELASEEYDKKTGITFIHKSLQ